MTTYIVSGYMRSGTSMMMHALEAGGLEAAFADREYLNRRHGDIHYKPNPDGFYELTRREYSQPGFPRMYDGKLVKVLMGGIPRIAAGDHKVVFMRRDYEEIRQSYEAFFDSKMQLSEDAYYQRVEDTLGILRVRGDVQLDVFNYRAVVEVPLLTFAQLNYNGWPIDGVKAACVIDEKQCRFRREELAIGA